MNHRSLRCSPSRLLRLVVPLHHPLRVRERPVLLDVRGRGEEEHLRGDVLGAHLAGLDLRARPSTTSRYSISEKSRTTSQSSFAMPSRCMRVLAEPTAGFCPNRK